jgi:hypothetical protein
VSIGTISLGEIRAAALTPHRHAPAGQVVELGDPALADEVDLLVVQREHHLGLLGDPREHGVVLQPGHEGQHVGLHDPDLDPGSLVHGEDVLHRPLRRIHAQGDPVRLQQLLEIQTELIVGALFGSRDDTHVLGEADTDAHDAQRDSHQTGANPLRHWMFPP